MWAIRTIGWISAGTLTLIFFGLRWLELFFWGCNFYAAISILSLLIRAGVNARNRIAMWIESHSPRVIQQLGMILSQTVAVRFPFWVSLIGLGMWIGYQHRDWQAYQEFTERRPANWIVVQEYSAHHYPGTAYDLLLADDPEGKVVTEFVPCENIGLELGMRISSAGFYQKGICNSFRGPRAYIVKEH